MIARIRKAMEEREEGFTLIELLVVMLIIGILAAIAIPIFLNQTKQAHGSAVKSDLHQVEVTLQSALVDSPPCVAVSQSSSTVSVQPYSDSTCTTANGSALTVGVTAGDSLQPASYGGSSGTKGSTGHPVKTDGTVWCLDMMYNTDSSTEYNLKLDPTTGTTTLTKGACS